MNPEQVDKLPGDRMIYLLEISQAFQNDDDKRFENSLSKVLSKLFKK